MLQRSFHLNITASDQDSPFLLSNIAILVNFQDYNDSAPSVRQALTVPQASQSIPPFQNYHWPFVFICFP